MATLPSRSGLAVEEDDRIYEDIEAPKYVDLSAPDGPRRDDRSWFCTRIGCDQRHEEVDPEALHKSFVLRVLAARSPNVRLQKTRSRIPRCPSTAPVKSAKEREQKSGGVASIPERIRVHPISGLRSTPLAKTRKQAAVAPSKPLTITPSRKQFPNGEGTSRINQSSKVMTSKAANGIRNAKKVHDATKSVSSQNLVTEMCCGMKKLHIGSSLNKKHLCKAADKGANDTCLNPSKSILHKRQSAHHRDKEEPLGAQERNDQKFLRGVGREPGAMEMDGKSRIDVSLLLPSVPIVSSGHLITQMSTAEDNVSDGREDEKDDVLMRQHNSLNFGDNEENFSTCVEKKMAPVPDPDNPKGCRFGKDGVSMDDKHSVLEDDKENSSPIYVTGLNLPQVNAEYENHGKPQKVVEVAKDKILHGISIPGEKYKKSKTTNPKPFRLRTNERGILKEANLERKLHLDSSKETRSACVKSKKSEGRGPQSTTLRRTKHLENGPEPLLTGPRKMAKLTLLQKPLTTSSPAQAKKAPTTNKGGILKHLEEKATTVLCMTGLHNTPSRMRKPATVPRGPVFHKINMPKGCTKIARTCKLQKH